MGQPRYFHKIIANELSSFTKYFDGVFYWKEPKERASGIFDHLQCKEKSPISDPTDIPQLNDQPNRRDAIVLDGVFNYHYDIQKLMEDIKKRSNRKTRVAIVAYNSYLRYLYSLANLLGLRKGPLPKNFMTKSNLINLGKVSNFECVKIRPVGLFPFRWLFIGRMMNWIVPLIPFIRNFSLSAVIVFRPIIEDNHKPSLTVVIPARNEMGNIRPAIQRMESLVESQIDTEVIFIEGHSKDETWSEIQKLVESYNGPFQLKAFQQTGKGKNDAVRLGFQHATKDLLVIQDADLTAEPEFLVRFYEAYRQGKGDFINGNRLVLPMEDEAMRPLNRLGNIFFAKALSSVLGNALGDSLCGTKMISRNDYQRVLDWRSDFGDFDPFGDFELLFPSAILALGIIDVPVIYKARTYGETNISRWSHGWMLLKMTTIGLFKIKTGRS